MEEYCQAIGSRMHEELSPHALSRCVRMGYPISALYSRRVDLPECVSSWFEATGKKQNAVAKKAGMLASKVSEIATGKNPDPQWSTVVKLAQGFGVPLHVFLEGPPSSDTSDGDDDRPREGSAVLEQLLLQRLDAEAPAEDTLRGDILRAQAALDSAQAALNRALRRPDSKSGAA